MAALRPDQAKTGAAGAIIGTPETQVTPRPGRYEFDTSCSAVTFRTRHLFGLAPVRGSFAIRVRTIDVAEPLASASIYVQIDPASFRTGNRLLAHCIMISAVDVALITSIGAAFGTPLSTRWPAIALALVLGAASFCALGVAVASLIRNSEAAPAVVQLVLFPLVFLSGSYMPIHSDMLNRISGALPVRPFNLALMGPFAQHSGFDWKDLGVLLAWGAAGTLIAVRRFRWDPRPE